PPNLEDYVSLFIRYFVAIKSLDEDGWGNPASPYFKAKVLRALIRVLSHLLGTTAYAKLTTEKARKALLRIDRATLSDDAVRGIQGSAGVQDLFETMRTQIDA